MLVSPGVDAAIAGVFGLLIGSFLNVVIYRLPQMLERQWAMDCADVCDKPLEPAPKFNLVSPPSRCPHCGHQIRWYENIPIVSYLALRGRCSNCSARISVRYPIVEAVTAALFALCAARWGISIQGAAWAVFAAILVCQFLIDFDTQYLPDDLNYVLLWLGLLVSSLGWTVPLGSAVWGAALGYLVLWAVYQGYRLLTGKEGMGYGDFKLLAALGAWLGVHYLIAIILLSSIVGAVIGSALIAFGRLAHKEIPIPFGPFLAGAGLVCLVVGPADVPALIPIAFPVR